MLERLKLLREREGISQKALADRIGVSQQSVNKYENHNVEPDLETLIRMADFFGTSVDWLIGRTGGEAPDGTVPAELTAEELRWVETWRRLSRRQKDALAAVADTYLT